MRYWLSVIALAVSVGTAQAEVYIAGQGGVAFPGSLSSVELSVNGAPGTVPGSDVSQKTSGMYGGKIGYYFPGAFNWLGVETDVYRSTPNLPAQAVMIGASGTISLPAVSHSMITWSPLVVLVRVPSGLLSVPLEPYAGVGLGVFFSSLSTQSFSSSSTDVGFVSQVGVRYRITPNWAAFGEWKYNRASLSHQNLQGTGLNVDATYSANLLSFGVAYHF